MEFDDDIIVALVLATAADGERIEIGNTNPGLQDNRIKFFTGDPDETQYGFVYSDVSPPGSSAPTRRAVLEIRAPVLVDSPAPIAASPILQLLGESADNSVPPFAVLRASTGELFTLDPDNGFNLTTSRARINGDDIQTGTPNARVRNSVSISVDSETLTPITFDTEDYDPDGMHSTSVNPSRFTIPAGQGGIYAMGGNVSWSSSTLGYRELFWRINGSVALTIGGVRIPPVLSTGVNTNMQCVAEYRLSAGDYVELFAYHNQGGTISVVAASGPYSPAAWIRKVAA